MKPIVTILLVIGCTFSTIADKVPSELKNLQAIRTKKIKQIDDAYLKALEKLKVKYTKRGDLESANAVNSAIKSLETTRKLASPKIREEQTVQGELSNARISCKTDCIPFEVGSKFFTEQHPSRFHFIPEEYEDFKVTGAPYTPKTPLDFEVKKRGLVTLLVEKNRANAFVADGWTISSKGSRTLVQDRVGDFVIINKVLEKGEYTFEMGKSQIGVRLLIK